jgi:hypothetical protein
MYLSAMQRHLPKGLSWRRTCPPVSSAHGTSLSRYCRQGGNAFMGAQSGDVRPGTQAYDQKEEEPGLDGSGHRRVATTWLSRLLST